MVKAELVDALVVDDVDGLITVLADVGISTSVSMDVDDIWLTNESLMEDS